MITGFSAMPFNDLRRNFQTSFLVWDATLADSSFANYGFITFDTNKVTGNCSGIEVLLTAETYQFVKKFWEFFYLKIFRAYTGVANIATSCSPATKFSDIAQVLVEVSDFPHVKKYFHEKYRQNCLNGSKFEITSSSGKTTALSQTTLWLPFLLGFQFY